MSAAFSAIIIVGAFVLPVVMRVETIWPVNVRFQQNC
jgi:hypothetical protein